MKYTVGIDIGSAHIKYCLLDLESYHISVKTIPLWTPSSVERSTLIEGGISSILNEIRGYNVVALGLVSSFERAFASDPKITSKVKERILTLVKEYDAYTFNEDASLINLKDHQWIETSVIPSIGYVASLLIDAGLFIQMNSASTVIAPIKEHKYTPINRYPYISGEAAWVGALSTPLIHILKNGLIFGCLYDNLSLYGASVGDVINILYPEKLKKMLKKISAPTEFVNNLHREHSINAFIQLLLGTDKTYGGYNIQNQIKIFALMAYHEFLNKIRKWVFQVLSGVDLDPEKTEIIISGIGKDPFLKDALYFIPNVTDIEKYFPPPVDVDLESLGVALAIAQKISNKDPIKIIERAKISQDGA